jgi:hypothetical protein
MLRSVVVGALAATAAVASKPHQHCEGAKCEAAVAKSTRFSFPLADFNATVIEDGVLPVPLDQAPYAAPPAELQALLAAAYLPTDVVCHGPMRLESETSPAGQTGRMYLQL